MFSLLLAIIYIVSISLGLPDSLLGSAWPVMYQQLGVPVSYAGIITMTIAGGTILSSLMTYRLVSKLGTGLVAAISVTLTAAALLGFSTSSSFVFLCLWAVPYGLGAGAVDAALNNYVAIHFASRHMSWIHCFWGVGAAVSPFIMSFALTRDLGWNRGYLFVAVIQVILSAVAFLSIPLWRKNSFGEIIQESHHEHPSMKQAISIKGVKIVIALFFMYCAVETTAGLWASTYLVMSRGVDKKTAASFASLFYLGITSGRFINGFIADKVRDKILLRSGILLLLSGVLLVCVPVGSPWPALIGLVLTGFGCAPVYPTIIKATPINFGEKNSQAIIGIQMASAYTATTFMPPFFGFLAGKTDIALYPFFLLIFALLMLFMSERFSKAVSR